MRRELLFFFSFRSFTTQRVDKIFIWMTAIMALVVQPLLRTYEVAPFLSYILVALSLASYASLPFYKTYPEQVFKGVAIAFGIVLLLARLSYTNSLGSSPVLAMAELFFSVMMIFRYGIKKLWWLPTAFLLLSAIRLYVIENQWFNHWAVDDPSGLSIIFFFFFAGFFLYLFTAFYTSRLQRVSARLDFTAKRMTQIAEQTKENTAILEQHYAILQELASHNSHELRRPVARIQAVIQLYDDLLDQEMDPHEMTGIPLRDELITNMKEVIREMDQFEHQILSKTHSQSVKKELSEVV